MVTKTVSQDHVLALWNSARIGRSDAETAFDAVDMKHVLPPVDYYGSLQRAAMTVVNTHSLDDAGKCKPFGLSGKRDSVGVEVRRIVKGAKRNEMPFLFSLGVCKQSDGTHAVELLEVDANECPFVASNHSLVETQADAYWKEECDFIPAADVTNAIVQVVKASCGWLLLDHGGAWMLPIDRVDAYHTVANLLQGTGVRMLTCRFDPVVNNDLMEHATEKLIARCMSVFDGQIDEVTAMKERGAKPRSNGQQTRLEQWVSAKETLEHNSSLLGKALKAVRKAAQAAREAIGHEALKAFAE